MGPEYTALQSLVKAEGLHTVCQEAGCPNIFECWEDREATFLIGGDQCTRRCDFCQIDTGKPQPPRPRRAAPGRRVGADDGPALRHRHRRRPRRPARRRRLAVRRDRARDPRAQPRHRRREPDPRLQRHARPAGARSSSRGPRCSRTTSRRCRGSSSGSARRSATSARSTCSPQARDFGLVTKSNLILGMGETREEVSPGAARPARRGLRAGHHHPVPAPLGRATTRSSAGCKPEEFVELERRGRRRSASPACCPDRWCVRRTAPVGCTVRRWPPARPTPLTAPPRPTTRDVGTAQPMSTPADPEKIGPDQAVRPDLPDGQADRPAARPVDRSAPSWSPRPSASRCFWLLPRRRRLLKTRSSSVVGACCSASLAALIIFGRRAQKAAYAPDGGPARRRRRPRSSMLRARLADRPDGRLHQAAGPRPPGRRPARASCWSARATPTGCGRCWPASAASTSGSPPRPRSTRSSSATTRARSRCPSWSGT